MFKLRKISPVLVLLAFLSPSALLATTVKTLNLVELVGRSERAFEGRCTNVVTTDEKVIGYPVVEYTFLVTRAIKGTTEGSTVVFRQLQSGGKQRRGIEGLPEYAVGDRVVLFLKKNSRLGLTSPVGLGQGIFTLKRTPQGETVVENLLRNQRLTEGLTEQSSSLAGLSPADYRVLQEGKPIPLSTFTSIVTRMVRSSSVDDRNK